MASKHPWGRWLKRGRWLGLGLLLVWLGAIGLGLWGAARSPWDGVLVLGGSIRREIHAAELAHQFPERPILISQGASDPCVKSVFDRALAPDDRVWVERCANSTFGNFYYSLPILQRWQVRRVKLVTSPSHLPRSLWMARIILGSHGIWVDLDAVTEPGIPGNKESGLKTSLDLLRSLGWAIGSQFYRPHCQGVWSVASIDMAPWRSQGFHCERQGGIEGRPRP
ncbi:MAG: YdcF family protein [Alkalinema sp. RU_4_3]|nr:YdcF family protein [Alkalinema sp. RU_4_3]